MKLYLKNLLLVILVAFLANSCNYYKNIYGKNVKETTIIKIAENANFEEVIFTLTPYLENVESFKWLANLKKYPSLIKPGIYSLNKGENNNTVVNRLRAGEQTPIDVKIGYEIKTLDQLATAVSKNLNISKTDFLTTLQKQDFVLESGLKGNQLLVFFLPNTYEFYWNISSQKFIDKMKNVYNDFWTDENKEKLKKLNLSILQINTLASIVQEESEIKTEQPKIAGLYLNRLKNNIKLQADPTVKYALKLNSNFNYPIKRIFYKDLFVDSPFNTYKNMGLPPAPIGLANSNALLATLNASSHNYIYMCADPDRPGYHLFEKNYEKHLLNAKKYSNWANSKNL
ncbi:MAG: endolytic transglycosylase MltG [Solirubrobacteraceae bacterium]